MPILTQKPSAWAQYRRMLPAGFRPITDTEALADINILSRAREFINRNVKNNSPIGTSESYDIGTNKYLFVVEPHYHSPNGTIKPLGWHKGCTVFIGPKVTTVAVNPTSGMGAIRLAESISGKYNIKS